MTERLRVAFCGNDPWSVPSLEALTASTHEVVLVATAAPKPAGRGSALRRTPVADGADRLGLPLAEVETLVGDDGADLLRSPEPDVLVVVAYGEILPERILRLPPRGAVNLHFSSLPELRGAAPVQHALLRGFSETGVTTIRMDAGLDTGPILLQRRIPIDPDDDTGSLGSRLAADGAALLVRTLDRLVEGSLTERPQDEAAASWAPKLTRDERILEWSRPSEEIVNRVRALAPAPAATTTFRGRGVKVYRASVVEGGHDDGAAGLLHAGNGGVPIVTTGTGSVGLLEVGPEGRSRMPGAAWLRGVRLASGERLG